MQAVYVQKLKFGVKKAFPVAPWLKIIDVILGVIFFTKSPKLQFDGNYILIYTAGVIWVTETYYTSF